MSLDLEEGLGTAERSDTTWEFSSNSWATADIVTSLSSKECPGKITQMLEKVASASQNFSVLGYQDERPSTCAISPLYC